MNENDDLPETHKPTPEEEAARRRRNLWLALALAGFVALVMAITIVRLSADPAMPDGGF